MRRKKIVIGNWKMNLTVPESTVLLEKLSKEAAQDKVEVVVCPSFIDIYSASKVLAGTHFKVGSQNVYSEDAGAFTGEVSAHQIRGLASYALVGHSERRRLFGEGDKMVAKKAAACVRHEITPIVCVGENLHEKMEGLTKLVVAGQVEASLADLTAKEVGGIIVAYEPVWAIGTGHVCEPSVADEVAKNIRNLVKVLHGEKVAEAMRIVYGGSLDAKNVKGFVGAGNLDGFLVGGASLDHKEFADIITAVQKATPEEVKKAERPRVAARPKKNQESRIKNKKSKY